MCKQKSTITELRLTAFNNSSTMQEIYLRKSLSNTTDHQNSGRQACVCVCVVTLTLRMLLIGMSVKVPAGAAGAAAGAEAAGVAAGGGAAVTACQRK